MSLGRSGEGVACPGENRTFKERGQQERIGSMDLRRGVTLNGSREMIRMSSLWWTSRRQAR
jgi:hypothetical protein